MRWAIVVVGARLGAPVIADNAVACNRGLAKASPYDARSVGAWDVPPNVFSSRASGSVARWPSSQGSRGSTLPL